MSTWSSRFGSWSGRFSPFGRSPTAGNPQVSDADFSYITSEDLRSNPYVPRTSSSLSRSTGTEDVGPPRDTDVLTLHFKSKGQKFPVHFPAYSIARGELDVGAVRDAAARKVGCDSRKVNLLYRGTRMTHDNDNDTCLSAGLREGSDILCSVGDTSPEEASSGSDSEDEGVELNGAHGEAAPKRRRNRNRNKKKKNKKASGTSTPSTLTDTLPVPPSATPRSSSPRPPPSPASPMDKLDQINSKLQSLLPECIQFSSAPPRDPAKREFEHKRLGEAILAQVLLKLDAVETEGDAEARARRKELVKQAQAVLNGLDNVVD
ncbi:hypothetical protein LTR66_008942 [Elasticomyces elasticus]|nr:hypothetical protein LTR66_008942 [Elasticomyces elasticus]KAK4984738.1 hypothetical protein LTR50_006417 [Elasticomyces elasticus]